MTKSKHILPTLLSAFIMLISMAAIGQSGGVYFWTAGSGSWHNANNWTVNGVSADRPPSKTDIAYINATQSIEILLQENAFAEALTTAGEGEIFFKALKNSKLEIAASCIFSENTTVNKNVKVELKGEGDVNYLHVPAVSENQMAFKSGSAYQNIGKSGFTRSACPSFTITTNPTRPTCNGFNDGIASVEEPTDGVGPYTYHWIGGPSARQWANVGAGTYTVIVFDVGQGAPCNTDVFVNEPGPLTVFSMNATPPLCPDGCDGTALPIVIGGNGGYAYNWSSGETGLNPSQLCTTFSLNVVDLAGCVYDTTYTFTNAPEPIEFQVDITDIDCFGNDNGAIDLTVQGGTSGYTYSWTGSSGFSASSEDISGLQPGDYTIVVEDANNCLADATFSISENVLLEATITKVDNICGGELEGDIQVDPQGGLPPYTFAWTGPNGFTSPNQNISGLESGLYELAITDAALCTLIEQVTVAQPVKIQIGITSVNVLCAGSATGSANASASAGTAGYTYQWSGPNSFTAGGPGILNVPAGIYEVTVTDANLCIQQESIEITEPDPILGDFTIGDITCSGGNDGSIQTLISGGNPGYTIAWSGPGGFSSSDLNITSLVAGTYIAAITDENACEVIETVVILDPDPMVLTADITPSSCAIGSDGGINLTVTGGTEPYFYSWTGPGGFASNAENLNNRPGGSYSVTITDANLCVVSATYTITSPAPLSADFIKENASCFGVSDGSIQVKASGGQEPYTFIWLGPAGFMSPDQNISNLLGGSYSVQIMDAGGCMGYFSVSVTQPPKINVTGPVTSVTCFGGTDGGIQSIVNGGTPGYTYSWTGPNGFTATTKNISGVPAGVYTLTATDAIGCSKSRDYTIAEPLEILVDATIIDVVCSGAGAGEIALSVSNGLAPFTYAWTGPGGFTSGDKDILNLPGGIYNLTVTDANDCAVTQLYEVQEPLEIIIDTDVTHISCFGEVNGEITTSVQGGLEPYTYSWSGPNGFTSGQGSIDNLEAGIYELILTDNVGCEVTLEVNVVEPQELEVSITPQDISCFGESDGAIESTVIGGTPGYTYSWIGPDGFMAATKDISGVPAGVYTLTAGDVLGCSISIDYTITEPVEISIDATITDVVCAGAGAGEIELEVSNGVAPFTYAWTGPDGFISTDRDITGLSGGIYNLTITDANDCVITQSHEVQESLEIIIDTDVTHISCFGELNGEITASVQGGFEPYTYSWSGPNGFTSGSESIDNLEAGLYELTLIDDAGCEVSHTVNVIEPAELEVTITPQDISCFESEDGSLTANIIGGTPPYIISWTGPDGFSSTAANITNLEAGDYDIEITDRHGCTGGGSQTIQEPLELELNVDITQPGCLVNDGSLTANVAGGTAATTYVYSWTNESGTEVGTGATVLNLSPGNFTITVTDDNGCEVQEIIELSRITFDIAAEINAVNCFNGSDGSISITPISGTPPYSYSWMGPAGFTATGNIIEDLITGQYELDIEDAAGCLYNMVYDVDQPEAMDFTAAVLPETCIGENDGSISLEISGGTPGYLVSWTGPEGFTGTGLNITDLAPGTYSASVIDIKGCGGNTAFDVGVGQDFTIVLTATPPICAGEMSGSINAEIIATPGSPGTYTYAWTGPDGFTYSNQNLSGLQAGNYEVIVTNGDGCTLMESIELTMPDSILIDVDVTQSNCLQTDGSASANVVGGVGALSVRWLDNSGNEVGVGNDLTGVSSGIYNIEVTDDAGCVISQTVVISDISGSIVGTVTHPICVGDDYGSIEIVVMDGTSPFTYEWTQGGVFVSNNEDVENLNAGIYNVIVTDGNGCIYSASFNVIDPDDIAVQADIIHVSCNANGGAVSLDITNASQPVEIAWTGPDGFIATGETLNNLIIGDYTYSITTGAGCFKTGTIQIESVPEMVVSADVKYVLCGGESTGYIDISVTGGASPISYSWSDTSGVISSIQDIADIPAGTYTVVITDANDCAITEVYDILGNEPLKATYTLVQPDCDINNGSISVVLSGGVVTTDYFISWTDSDGNSLPPTADLTNLGVGVYVFSGSDDNGCSIDTTIALSNPDADISVFATHTSCPGISDGTITLSISGVEEPIMIAWTGPGGFTSNNQDLIELEPGEYEYTITGSNNCEYIGTSVINPADPIDVTAIVLKTCFGIASGEIELGVSGGNEPYEFQWTGPDGFTAESQNINDLFAGEYQVVITYSGTCSETLEYTVIENPEIVLDFTQIDISCFGENTGSIDLSISGGIAPYTVFWTGSGGFISQDLSLADLHAGEYLLLVTDGSGCVADTIVVILESQPLEVLETIVGAGCSSPGSLGMIEVQVTGGTPGYFISWTGPNGFVSAGFALIDLEPGIYNYTITDDNGCVYEDEIEILEVEPIEIDLDVQHITCFGERDGRVTATIIGGFEPYQIIWKDPREFGINESMVEDLLEGSYTIIVSDSAGCTISRSFEIVEPDPISIKIIETNDASCNTFQDGSIAIEVIGGSTPYSFTWTSIVGFESNEQNIDSLAFGQYDLHVVDANGCEANTSVEITYMLEIFVNAGDDLSICQSDLPVQLTGTGMNVDEFVWMDWDGNLLSEAELLNFSATAGTHSLIFIGANGLCSIQDTIDITVIASPIADAGPDREVFIEEVFTLGGNPTSESGVSYIWSPNPTQSLNVSLANPSGYLLESTEFVVEVTDENGCVGTDTVFVEVLPDVKITSGFTPNGDGINDTWVIDNIELFPNNVVHIFNRWGQAVYEQKSYNSGTAWDGTYEGKKLPVGTYYYTIELKDERFPEPFTGPITIYR